MIGLQACVQNCQTTQHAASAKSARCRLQPILQALITCHARHACQYCREQMFSGVGNSTNLPHDMFVFTPQRPLNFNSPGHARLTQCLQSNTSNFPFIVGIPSFALQLMDESVAVMSTSVTSAHLGIIVAAPIRWLCCCSCCFHRVPLHSIVQLALGLSLCACLNSVVVSHVSVCSGVSRSLYPRVLLPQAIEPWLEG